MSIKKTIVLKVTGELIAQTNTGLTTDKVFGLAKQIKQLSATHRFGLVIGGGNFFRGNQHNRELTLTAPTSHYVGMLATTMNGLIIQDIFEQEGIKTSHFCALSCPEIGKPIYQKAIQEALDDNHCLIFTGGTGNPFFTTDTNAVLRTLQINADELWKGTKVTGVYTSDPATNPQATFLPHVTYTYALEHQLGIIDQPAIALAQQYKIKLRIFNIFSHNALIQAAQEDSFGSRISYL